MRQQDIKERAILYQLMFFVIRDFGVPKVFHIVIIVPQKGHFLLEHKMLLEGLFSGKKKDKF